VAFNQFDPVLFFSSSAIAAKDGVGIFFSFNLEQESHGAQNRAGGQKGFLGQSGPTMTQLADSPAGEGGDGFGKLARP